MIVLRKNNLNKSGLNKLFSNVDYYNLVFFKLDSILNFVGFFFHVLMSLLFNFMTKMIN